MIYKKMLTVTSNKVEI